MTGSQRPDKKEMIKLIDNMIETMEGLPPGAMNTYVTHYDLCSVLILLSSIFKAELAD